MNKRLVAVGLVSLMMGSAGTSAIAAPFVPCTVFGLPTATCVSPMVQGVVDRQWVGLILRFNGSNGGPDEITVVTIGTGGNGLLTLALDSIKPEGEGGDRMSAAFRAGKLVVTNAIYLPGEAHCCFTHIAARRFGFHNRHLVAERVATVRIMSTASQIDAALNRGPSLL